MKKVLVICVICLSLVIIWFRKGLIFAGGEGGIPFYNLELSTKLYPYAWRDVGTGYPGLGDLMSVPIFSFFALIAGLGVPGYLIQAGMFFLLLTTGTVSMYFLIKNTVGSELKNKNIPLIGAIFYLLNPYSMTQIWGRGLNMQFFPFALHPLFLTFFILAIRKKNVLFVYLALLSSYILSPAYTNIGYAISLWFPLFLYLLFYLFIWAKEKRDKVYALTYFVFLSAGWILTNMFWILAFLDSAKQQYSLALDNPKANLGSLLGVSKDFPFSMVIRLMQRNFFFTSKIYGEIYSNFIFLTISWLIPLVSLFSIKTFKDSKYYKYFLVLFIISIFVCLGANPPFGKIFLWLFENISYFQIFRNPYEKFGLFLLLAFTPFFSVGLIRFSEWLSELTKKKNPARATSVILIFLISGVFVWPMWTGKFSGGIKKSPWIKVPNYYDMANSWIEEKASTGCRLLQLPLIPGDGLRYNWEHPYQGIEPSEFIFSLSSIGKNAAVNKEYYNVLLQRLGGFRENKYGPDPDLTNSKFKSDNFYQELEKLNVCYIVLHNDIDYRLADSPSPEEVQSYLQSQEKINKVESFGQLDLYEVDIDKDISLIYSPTLSVDYIKKNPTEYIVTVREANEPFEIYFLNLYSPGWKAFIDGKEITDHYKVNSYANAWKINQKGNFDILIDYDPQNEVKKGQTITKYSLLAILILFLLKSGLSEKLRYHKKSK